MDNYMIKLIRVLEILLDRHKSLLKLCHEQKQALIDNDIAKLEKIIEKLNRLTAEIGELEEKRKETVRAASDSLGLGIVGDAQLSMLIQVVQDQKAKIHLTKVQTELIGVIHELEQINELVAVLTNQSISYTDQFLNMISTASSGKNGYGYSKNNAIGGYLVNLRT